jgi:hypothetical protein
MSAEIDVHDTSGPLVANDARAVPRAEQKSAADDPSIDERVAAIIRENSHQTARPAAVAAR